MRLFIVVFIIFLFFLFNHSSTAQRVPPEKPKLIIGIVIDQMKYNYINNYWENFGEDGIKKLVTEGSFCKNARYNYLYTQSSVGQATIATGTTPTYHGIISDYWFDRMKEEEVYCTSDYNYVTIGGNYEAGNMSPNKLLATTVSDELKLSNNFKSKVFGISLNPHPAILSSGHNANAAYWYDEKKGSWITSSYYLDSLPSWVINFNNKLLPDIYLDRSWTPISGINEQPDTSGISYKTKNFTHDLTIFKAWQKIYGIKNYTFR